MLTPSIFSCSFSFFFVVQFPIESGRNEAITTGGQEINNWTKVSAILWCRSTKIIALKGNYQGEQIIIRLRTEPVALEPRKETPSTVERFAAFAAAARPERLKPQKRQPFKRNILDSLGCATASLSADPFRALRCPN
jgi:hypothetical protein